MTYRFGKSQEKTDQLSCSKNTKNENGLRNPKTVLDYSATIEELRLFHLEMCSSGQISIIWFTSE